MDLGCESIEAGNGAGDVDQHGRVRQCPDDMVDALGHRGSWLSPARPVERAMSLCNTRQRSRISRPASSISAITKGTM